MDVGGDGSDLCRTWRNLCDGQVLLLAEEMHQHFVVFCNTVLVV